ncbi:hypothetical protein GO986_20715 [Deinococcus sp. HMF7620]|uniref:Uncharacterized protein n=1 Tax=Deinococcus arboris TaxID=2682977 RepID=A0A7C9M4M0_9DEIO|nr:hypothetical protein [Deinococcus arboris]MVN89162.1 hypothetical protein [Deinococcus arboris]
MTRAGANRNQPQPMSTGERALAVLLMPVMLLLYLSPILVVGGGIVWFGLLFGENGTRVQRQIEQAFTAQDQPAFEALSRAEQRQVVQQLNTVADLATQTNQATLTTCRPERVPLAHDTLGQLKAAQLVVPPGMTSVREQLKWLTSDVNYAVTHCRVTRSRFGEAGKASFGNSVWRLKQQIGHLRALLPTTSPRPNRVRRD